MDSYNLTILPTVQTWFPVTTFSSETLKNFEWVTISRRRSSVDKETVKGYFDNQDVSFFSEDIRSLEAKWTSVLQSRGTILKNNEASFIIRFHFYAQVDKLLNAPRT